VRTLNDLSGVYQKCVADTVQRFGGARASASASVSSPRLCQWG
jgi:hypothetical protein